MQETNPEEFLSDQNAWFKIFKDLEIPVSAEFLPNPKNAERVLVMCRGGNCRSVAVSFLLKYKYMKDALAASFEKNSLATLWALGEWAHRIIVVEYNHIALAKATWPSRTPFFIDLSPCARLQAEPFDINFLKQIDEKLKEIFRGQKQS